MNTTNLTAKYEEISSLSEQRFEMLIEVYRECYFGIRTLFYVFIKKGTGPKLTTLIENLI